MDRYSVWVDVQHLVRRKYNVVQPRKIYIFMYGNALVLFASATLVDRLCTYLYE